MTPDEKVMLPGKLLPRPAAGRRWCRRPFHLFQWRDLRTLIEETSSAWNRHNAPRLGAALAFYTMFSLTPLLLIVVSIAGMAFGRQAAEGQIVWQVRDLVGATAAHVITGILQGAANTTHGVLASIAGFAVLLLGASAVFVELRDALNTIREVPAAAGSGLADLFQIVKARLFSFSLVLAVGFLLLTSLGINAALAAFGRYSTVFVPLPASMLQIVNDLVSFVVLTALFAAIYRVIPEVRLEWRDVWLGAVVTSILFTLGKVGIGLYLGKASFASAYGAAASTVLFILWVYYSSQVFFLGAEFTRSFAHRFGSHPEELSTPSSPETLQNSDG